MKKIFSRVLHLMISVRLTGLATLALSSVVSVLDKRLTWARWDGEDWEFKWSDGCLYWSSHQVRPRFVTNQNIGSYLTMYRPKDGDVILEVGAGSGTEVGLLSNMVGPSGRVIAIEADPSAVRRLQKQAAGLRYQNVTVLGTAVGNHEGTVQLNVASADDRGSSTAAVVGDSSVAVRCTTLRDILIVLGIDTVAYMKMNIEGAEYEALRGLGSEIADIETMMISCHDFTGDPAQETYQQVYDYLVSWNLQVSPMPHPKARWEEYYIFARSNSRVDSSIA